MSNDTEVVRKLYLVQCYLLGDRILDMPDSAARKGVPFYFLISKHLLQLVEDMLGGVAVTYDL